MAKTIPFNIKFSVNGKDVIVSCKEGVRDLGRALGTIPGQTEKISKAFQTLGSVSTLMRNMSTSLQSLTGVMHEMTNAYQVQEEAELKLQTVMRQRMNSSDDDINKIKELASEQQKLGVVGDEVQLAGAQQVATFLKEKDSIEKLLPAMNNLAVQRKGLNVTSEDMVNIGNLVGKVMQGQTSALTRVGITFDAAQQKVLKYGTESEKAATLAQVITDNVGNMNAELAKTDAGKAKQMANSFGDMQEQIGKAFAQYEPLMQGFSQLGIVAMSVGQLGTAVIGATKALIAFTNTSAISAFNSRLATAAVTRLATSTGIFAATSSAATFAVKGLTWAIRALEVATVVGAVIAAVSIGVEALGAVMNGTSDATDDLKASLSDEARVLQTSKETENTYTSVVNNEIKHVQDLQKVVEDSNASLKDRKAAIEQIKSIVPDYIGYIDSEGVAHTNAANAITTHITQLKALQTAMSAFKTGQKIRDEQSQAQYDYDVAQANVQTKSRNVAAVRREYYDRNTNNRYHYTNYSSTGTPYEVSTKEGRAKLAELGAQSDALKAAQAEQAAAKKRKDAADAAAKFADNWEKEQIAKAAKSAGMDVSRLQTAVTMGNGDYNATTSKLFDRNNPSQSTGTKETSKSKSSKSKSKSTSKTDDKVFNDAAVTTKQISDNISILQTKLANTDPKSEKYKEISNEITKWQTKLDDINRGYETGSLADYEARIGKVDDTLKKLNLSEAERNDLLKERDELQAKADDLNNAGIEKGSIDDLNNQLSKLQKQFNSTASLSARLTIKAKIDGLQRQIDEQTNGKLTIPVEPEADDATRDKEGSYQNAESRSQTIQRRFEIGIIGKDEAQKQIDDLNEQLKALGLKPITIELKTDTDEAKEKLDDLDNTLRGSFGGSVGQAADQFLQLGQYLNAGGDAATGAAGGMALVGQQLQAIGGDGAVAKIGATMAAIGQIILSFTTAAASPAVTSTGWGWLAFVGAGLASVATVISTIQSYATGGIVPGNSYSGDKVTAHVNSGEMILNMQQQRRLFAIANGNVAPKLALPALSPTAASLNTQQVSGGGMVSLQGVDFRVRGRELVGVMRNETQIASKSGRRTGIKV